MEWVHRLRWGRVLGALALVAILVGVIVKVNQPQAELVVPPREYMSDFWVQTVGGDEPLTDADWDALNDPANSDLGKRAQSAATIAREVLKADLTGVGREKWQDYWQTDSEAICDDVDIKAANAVKLPVGTGALYAKVLLVWSGSCTGGEIDVSYLYERLAGDEWEPVREWEIPSYDTGENAGPAAEPASWELKNLTDCGGSGNEKYQAKIIVANAFEVMCQDAKKDGVDLEVTSAYRTRQEQYDLYKKAVDFYGSATEASRWVAPADENTCSSKHCAGTAINVSADSLEWLNQIVGCSVDGKITQAQECAPSAVAVRKMNLYGFSAPVPYVPTYLEFILPVESEKVAGDCHPEGTNTPTMVAQIFRCRLEESGMSPEQTDEVVAQALVVSRCESGWNPLARAYSGRFAQAPHPVTGKIYDQAGVFMLTREEASYLIDGGYSQVTDPVANINAAASLWLLSGWERWGCATGAGEIFEQGPVLPAYGGPDIPAWARTY